MNELEARAEAALRARDIAAFMRTFDEMARQRGAWTADFVRRTAALVAGAWVEYSRWAMRIGRKDVR